MLKGRWNICDGNATSEKARSRWVLRLGGEIQPREVEDVNSS